MADVYYDESGSLEMATKLFGSKVFDTSGLKPMIENTYGSFEGLTVKAREQGNWEAKYDLSLAYKVGIPEFNVEKDKDKQMGWLESSIDEGYAIPAAVYELGTLYDIKGTVSHQRKAHELYHKAAKCGVVEAELTLAESYMYGVEGVINMDVEEAFKWYGRAADEDQTVNVVPDEDISDYAPIMMRGTSRKLSVDMKMKALAILYEHYITGDCPEGEPQPLKAIHYLKKAAEVGHRESQTKLGQTYLTGVPGVPKDLKKAKRWLGKAAKNGCSEAKEILEKFDDEGIIEAVQPAETETDEQHLENFARQCLDILEEESEQSNHHPNLIKSPLMFSESMFTQFPDSPTAQRYLKAFKLAEEGFSKFQGGNFTEAVKLMACSYLYENTVIHLFPLFKMPKFRNEILSKIFEELEINGEFFEGLVLLVPLYGIPVEAPTVNFESFKIDFKKAMFLKNVIHLIEKKWPKLSPSESNGNFEESYTCWVHALYDFLGSLYTVGKSYDEGAQAFEKAIKCCSTNFEAKAGFAFCIVNIYFSKKDQKVFNTEDQAKNSYLRWEATDLRNKAEQLFLEYVNEAPPCDKKYPNCHYHLASLYMGEGNIKKALEWKEKGEDAEEKRLPFMQPVAVDSKKFLLELDYLPTQKKTSVTTQVC